MIIWYADDHLPLSSHATQYSASILYLLFTNKKPLTPVVIIRSALINGEALVYMMKKEGLYLCTQALLESTCLK
jgi:hypothetical protein